MNVLKASAFIGLQCLAFTVPAHASDAAKACDDPRILKVISSRFQSQSSVVDGASLRIDGFTRVHQHRSHDKSEFKHFARRACGATARLSNGLQREVWYLIESDAGLVGLGNSVEFCVSGFDRWNVYNASCRVLR